MRMSNVRGQRQEGAAMLVVMLVLLAATATASFAFHATSFEVRAAGNHRMMMQTGYVAEAALVSSIAMAEQMGPALGMAMEANTILAVYEPFERNPTDPETYRFYLTDFPVATPPIETSFSAPAEPSYGNFNRFRPFFVVDANDKYDAACGIPGMPVGTMCVYATFTARGRMQLQLGGASEAAAAGEYRAYHEGASDARALVLLGVK
jgi:hypothetical protein